MALPYHSRNPFLEMIKATMGMQQIASSGGGLRFSAKSKTTMEMQQIASSASGTGARINITEAGSKTTLELQQIASSGKGCVQFEF